MRQALVKIKDKDLISYNFHLFEEEEEIIIFSLTEFNLFLEQLESSLQKSTIIADKVIQGQVKTKNKSILQIGDELKASLTITESIPYYNFQASLENYYRPDLRTKKRKRVNNIIKIFKEEIDENTDKENTS